MKQVKRCPKLATELGSVRKQCEMPESSHLLAKGVLRGNCTRNC